MAAMADPGTGLVADNIGGDLSPASRAKYTSPTNIGAYIWSAVAARRTGLITTTEETSRVRQTLTTLEGLEIHEPSGMFYNWYDPKTGAKLTEWPELNSTGGHNKVYPFLSSVDNAWLATALTIVKDQIPALAGQADALLADMDFGYYYNPAERQIRGGFWVDPPAECSVPGNYRGGATVYYTCHHYGAFNTEPRMASYLGIAAEQIPPLHYFGSFRTFPRRRLRLVVERAAGNGRVPHLPRPAGLGGRLRLPRHAVGADLGRLDVRGADGSPVRPGGEVGHEELGAQPPDLRAGADRARQGGSGLRLLGLLAGQQPGRWLPEYGVDQLGMNADGYSSDKQRTTVDEGYARCAGRRSRAPSYGEGVVTPHASFLALRYAPGPALANLAKLRRNFDAYGPGGFYDTVNVTTGKVAKRYLSLDQGMIMAALGNALGGDVLRHAFSQGPMEQRVAPLMRMEEFSLAPTGTP